MTVRRKSDEAFKADYVILAQAVRNVLKANPSYRNTIEHKKNCLFTTNVKPHWWLLATNMSISLEDSNSGTRVTVQTKSQSFILGDVFNCYNRYIRDFLRDLKIELRCLEK